VSPRLRRRAVRYAVVGVVGTALLAGTSGAAPAPPATSGRADVVSAAHPTSADRTVHEETVRIVSILGLRPRANAVATTSAGCRGCQGAAVTVQVVEVAGGWRAQADNVASAWARCRGCTAEAMSVQLVVLRRAATLTTHNRALAVTGDCRECTTRAAAYQVVLDTNGKTVDLDRLRDEVVAWAAQQPDAPEGGVRARDTAAPPRPQRLLAGLERRVSRLVDGAVLRSRAAVRTE
jgi:hypothetical protein